MKQYDSLSHPSLARALAAGAVGVLPTDTLYGLVASAGNEAAVERIYRLKNRSPEKQLILLISSPEQMFDPPPEFAAAVLSQVWPGKVSVILPSQAAPAWLLRGGDSLAYRLPADAKLRALIKRTGPLVAPSANPESLPPALTAGQAEAYFGDQVDFYVDGGPAGEEPSRLIRLRADGRQERLR